MKDDRLYLIHISEAIERIEEYTKEGAEAFLEDHKTKMQFCVTCIPWLSLPSGSQAA